MRCVITKIAVFCVISMLLWLVIACAGEPGNVPVGAVSDGLQAYLRYDYMIEVDQRVVVYDPIPESEGEPAWIVLGGYYYEVVYLPEGG